MRLATWCAEAVDRADDADDGGVLLQADEVVEQRRDAPANRLGEHHEAHGLAWESPSERAVAVWLQWMWMLSIPARYTSAT